MKDLIGILVVLSCVVDFGENYLNNMWHVALYQNDTLYSAFETKIPAGTYTSAVENIFWDTNDVKYRFIVDTFATITLNGQEIGKTSNMFTRYSFDIKDYLMNDKNKKNLLNVTIDSAVKVAESTYNNHAKNYIVYPKCVPDAYNGECHVNHIRKMQASFSWDWGPAIPSSGIWRDVEIIPIIDVHVMDYTLDVYQVNNKDWKVNVTVLLELAPNSPSNPISSTLQITLENLNTTITKSEIFIFNNGDKRRIISTTLDVPKRAVFRWWPNGFGQQHLYNLMINVDTEHTHIKKIKRIGFRTVELVQEPLENGLSFYFRINGVPIFAKGSNVIPIHIAPEKSTNYIYLKNLLWSAKEAHMNMLRVWGGGVYESEKFYDIADALGIMIWQDFMFACAMYPTTSDFLDSVREEVVQNVWRLKSHTSVVLWAGNNENEAALYGNWYGTGKDQVYRDDYIKLYVNVIKPEVERLDKTRPFVVSSPSNGQWADDNGWIGTDPYSSFYGDIHYYNYINDGWNINNYPRPRFSSEYGIQSLPSIHTFESVTKIPIEDLSKDSKFIKHRQHLPDGNILMEMMIEKNFNIPTSSNSYQDFENYIYLSQINQAQSVKVQTESYRQARSSFNDIGEGFTMGALYWQLNDVWQAPTWSSIDIDGRWKILHNYAKNFFAPIIISPRLLPTNDLTIFIISDELTPRLNCTVQINVHKIYMENNPKLITQFYRNISVPANAAYELTTIKLNDILEIDACGGSFNEAKKKCIVELILENSSGDIIAPPNYVYPTSPKNMILPSDCNVIASVGYARGNTTGGYQIEIESSCTLLFVWLDLPGYIVGRFSENGFHILRGSKTIHFDNSPFYINIQAFTRKLNIITLGDIYSTTQRSPIICIGCLD
ncbi:hypothetical protein PV328_003021 [Microctonus aethiopoides]|uniref:Beta-mannosidase n=1 Tax=Microctonus aethiopoides TaxID=144406 RepID=A0AA39F7H7_9HYME|nr:hypothetical protein PV328_003021 [Microctonus aethiopoides]